MQFSTKLFLSAAALVAPIAMSAASITAPAAVNGLVFSNISCSISSNGGAASTPNTCNQINATAITSPGNGISFSSGFTATAGAFEDATIKYSVADTTGSITNVGLYFNGYFEGLGISSVTESVYDANNNNALIAVLTVNCGNAGCTTANEQQNINLNGSYQNLYVEKDIDVMSGSHQPGNYAGLSIVDQTFTTTPEPASIALLGAGLLVAGLARRKMVKA